MFEFDKYEAHRHSKPPARPETAHMSATGIQKISFLMWGEHCIECAAPACFSSCDLYEARPDKRCRRFEYGLYRNRNFPSLHGFGAEVVFKRWGKIETRGNVRMMPVWQVRILEQATTAFSLITNTVGRLLGKMTGNIRWNYATYALMERFVQQLRKGQMKVQPDGFLVEIYNPTPEPLSLQLVMSIDRSRVPMGVPLEQLPHPFVDKLTIDSGFFHKLIPATAFKSIIESGLAFNIALLPEADKGARLVFLSLDFVTLSSKSRAGVGEVKENPKAIKPNAKCMIFDLDNTLWDGVLLEREEVVLRPGMKDLIEMLDKRGILLSIASKNAHDHAWSKLQELGLTEFFLYPKINWLPKSQNIAQIAKDLNIGLDACVFIDDSEFELKEVGQALPQVACHHVSQVTELVKEPRFQGSSSGEAGRRRKLYQENIMRHQAAEGFSGDYIDFLRSCGISLDIQPYASESFERITELVQRTNQLNFSGRKYDRNQIQLILGDAERDKWVLKCQDKFGSYGTVGFCIVRQDAETIEIEDFMLSCRVQGKFIEQALFDFLAKQYSKGDVQRLWVNFCQTDRNAPAKQVLDELKFKPDEKGGLGREVKGDSFACNFIEVRGSVLPH
ncbi:FkbH like protein [Nitrosococcus halophilus Nc 4]|uniref:FkbH like protein n=1 Tax=Nitrosococcus halophilus (strain Nc4) TaxID=472759 RepID=D5C027_NITHN|nr:HAD-IIIC family phosphatase [Nitrosococcus halophilus]ADE16274.1 FkbH like protein [Nitrosococcus halophilus Nc 4]